MEATATHPQVIQSPNDRRKYKSLYLKNKVKILLISDPEADKSAVAMNVNVGCMEDPITSQGLAHFLEHMLFLGTEQFPDQSEYMAYLNKNAGMYNAYTDLLETNYFFSSSNEGYEGGIERFAQFFIKPLFTESCTDRELNAVNSEHEKNINDDMWREFQLSRFLSKKDHPYNKFGTGNLKSLKHEGIRDDLIKFYNTYYSANLMCLVLESNKSIEDLEVLAEQYFSEIPNKDTVRQQYTDIPYGKEELGEILKISPIKDENQLSFTWILENTNQYYRNDPCKYISHLIGHEGENSLLSILIEQGLALKLSSYPWVISDCFTEFNVQITLTKEGLAHPEKVYGLVFKYMHMLREKGTQEWIFNEIQKVNQLKFANKDKEKGMNYVLSLASRMQKFPIEEVLIQPYLMEKFDSQLFKKFINNMNWDNLKITLKSRSVESDCKLVEEIYGTQYNREKFTENIIQLYNNPPTPASKKQIDLPLQNIFIPENMKLLATDFESLPTVPQHIHKSNRSDIYFKQDNTFKVPKATVKGRILTNDLGYPNDPNTAVFVQLWLNLLKEHINELSYLAEMAYLSSSISDENQAIQITVSGFNDSIPAFLVELFKKITSFKANEKEDAFRNHHKQLIQDFENFFLEVPYLQGFNLVQTVLLTGSHSMNDLLSAAQTFSFERFCEQSRIWLQNVRFEWLVMGNIEQETAIQMVNDAEEALIAGFHSSGIVSKDAIADIRCVDLDSKNTYIYEGIVTNPQEQNSVLVSYYQYAEMTLRSRILGEVAKVFLSEPVFSELRTKQQLGYIVVARFIDLRGVVGLFVLIQSNVKSPHYLATQTDQFMGTMLEAVDKITEEDLTQYLNSVKVTFSEKFTSVLQEASSMWVEIFKHRYLFNIQQLLVEQVGQVQLDEFKEFFHNVFGKNQSKFEIHLTCAEHQQQNEQLQAERIQKEANLKIFNSESWLQRKLPLYPDFFSAL